MSIQAVWRLISAQYKDLKHTVKILGLSMLLQDILVFSMWMIEEGDLPKFQKLKIANIGSMN